MTVTHQTQAHLPTRFGNFIVHVFKDDNDIEHMALVSGQLKDNCLVRIHSECATGDILGSLRCDCREQLSAAMQKISEEGCGLIIYMRGHEGRGIGLTNKIKAYTLQDNGMDTAEANLHLGFPIDGRDYSAAMEILKYFGIKSLRLLTNNQGKIDALESAGITLAERVPIWTTQNPHNKRYLDTKKKLMGHLE